jgi:hypothetical protein
MPGPGLEDRDCRPCFLKTFMNICDDPSRHRTKSKVYALFRMVRRQGHDARMAARSGYAGQGMLFSSKIG